jgi:serine/threonine-protein kinase ATR
MMNWISWKRQQPTREETPLARRFTQYLDKNDSDKKDSLFFVENLLVSIPQNVMADASYRCKAYARALKHFEQHVRIERNAKTSAEMVPLYQHLQTIYAHIDEPDGMEGISTKFSSTSLKQQILEHEAAGRWADAQTCYELSLQKDSHNISHHIGLINCLKTLGHLGML